MSKKTKASKYNKHVAKLTKIDQKPSSLIGKFKNKLKVKGNILSTGIKWDSQFT